MVLLKELLILYKKLYQLHMDEDINELKFQWNFKMYRITEIPKVICNKILLYEKKDGSCNINLKKKSLKYTLEMLSDSTGHTFFYHFRSTIVTLFCGLVEMRILYLKEKINIYNTRNNATTERMNMQYFHKKKMFYTTKYF